MNSFPTELSGKKSGFEKHSLDENKHHIQGNNIKNKDLETLNQLIGSDAPLSHKAGGVVTLSNSVTSHHESQGEALTAPLGIKSENLPDSYLSKDHQGCMQMLDSDSIKKERKENGNVSRDLPEAPSQGGASQGQEEIKIETESETSQNSEQGANEEPLQKEIYTNMEEADRNTSENTAYRCPNCEFAANEESSLYEHLLKHKNEFPFNCLLRDQLSQPKLVGRFSPKGLEDRPFKCPFCDYRAITKKCLTQHLFIHSEDKPFKCSECDFKTSHKASLCTHKRVHSNQKPHECPHCDYKASRKSDLSRHLHTHTGHKPHQCPLCNYRALRKSDLNQHMHMHTGQRPYKCPYCEYRAPYSSSIGQHVRIHTGDKPFKCPHCEYTAARSTHLERHIYTHTGYKPYKCPHCEFRATQKSNLAKHVRNHTTPGNAKKPDESADSLEEEGTTNTAGENSNDTDAQNIAYDTDEIIDPISNTVLNHVTDTSTPQEILSPLEKENV